MRRLHSIFRAAAVSALASALALTVVGCCSTGSVAVAPPPYQSDEVAISVYLLDPDGSNPTVIVVPESTYLVADRQTPHWLPGGVGEITEIKFKAGDPFERSVPCSNGHCKPARAPSKQGKFPYSVTIRHHGTDYKLDPQLIIGG
jgi:hypothetical protein